MAKSMKKLMTSVVASSVYANTPEAKRKADQAKKEDDTMSTVNLDLSNKAKDESIGRLPDILKALKDAGIDPADQAYIDIVASFGVSQTTWAEHMTNCKAKPQK